MATKWYRVRFLAFTGMRSMFFPFVCRIDVEALSWSDAWRKFWNLTAWWDDGYIPGSKFVPIIYRLKSKRP